MRGENSFILPVYFEDLSCVLDLLRSLNCPLDVIFRVHLFRHRLSFVHRVGRLISQSARLERVVAEVSHVFS